MKLAPALFAVDPRIRYVAVNAGRRIVEMEQSLGWPSANPSETDRMEELVVNPTVIEILRRRGELDLDGLAYVLVRYGVLFQLVLPWRDGHVSVGLEPEPGPGVVEIAEKVREALRSI